MNDYSQNIEQPIILEFFKDKPNGRFLDIGAFDGITGSNTYALSELGWSGVCVEASPFAFTKLIPIHGSNKNVQCVLGAVTCCSDPACFHDTEGQRSTCMPNQSLGAEVLHKFHVATITPVQIAISFGQHYDFVSLDIEGIDLDVLPMCAPILVSTQLICVEDAIPNAPFDEAYYQRLLETCARLGFKNVVGRTSNNTLIART